MRAVKVIGREAEDEGGSRCQGGGGLMGDAWRDGLFGHPAPPFNDLPDGDVSRYAAIEGTGGY